MQPTVTGALNAHEAGDKASFSGRTIATFAWQHMKAATIFRDHVKALEVEHASSALGAHFDLICAYASGCLMSSVSCLEALINEYFMDPNGKLRPTFTDFEREFWGKGGVEMKHALVKFQDALIRLNLQSIDETGTIYKDAAALIKLRNSLVHHKPTWDPDRSQKADLTSYLSGKYSISPYVQTSSDFTTMQSMSHGCCQWAINTAFLFLHHFDSTARLNDIQMSQFWSLES